MTYILTLYLSSVVLGLIDLLIAVAWSKYWYKEMPTLKQVLTVLVIIFIPVVNIFITYVIFKLILEDIVNG